MIEYIINQWRNKKSTIFLIMLGFFIGNLVLSLGISMSVENIKQTYDKNSGVPEKQLELTTSCIERRNIEGTIKFYKDISKYGEVQILSLEKIILDKYNKEYQVIPVCFQKNEGWHIPIIKGRYFKTEEIWDSEKQIIIGKEIAKENKIKLGDTLWVNGQSYIVIGISGRENRTTQWDNVVYVSWNDFLESNRTYIDTNTLFSVLKSGKDAFIENFSKEEAKAFKLGMELTYTYMEEVGEDSVRNSILITCIATILVFAVAIINITNLMIYWMLERQKDLAVLKALGANNRYLTRCLILEVFVMTAISAFLAVFLQVLVEGLFGDILAQNGIYATVTLANFIFAFMVTCVCGLLSAIMPARQVMKVQPADSIKE